ncbi:hypothetical protein FACS1894152_5230 [Bacilli bacterium]|nr:hypothetical protein FACS1894152_5230 [Bacilli bacterium]
MTYIRYVNNPNGVVQASLVDGVRTGSIVKQKYIANLGRVIDREKGIYKNRERGEYQYSLETGYSEVPGESTLAETVVWEKEKLILDLLQKSLLRWICRIL